MNFLKCLLLFELPCIYCLFNVTVSSSDYAMLI